MVTRDMRGSRLHRLTRRLAMRRYRDDGARLAVDGAAHRGYTRGGCLAMSAKLQPLRKR